MSGIYGNRRIHKIYTRGTENPFLYIPHIIAMRWFMTDKQA